MLKMYLGETRKLTLAITADIPEPFVIHNATYVMTKNDVEQAKGDCTVTAAKELIIYVTPATTGTYWIEYKFTIADEVIKKRASIYVE